MTKSRLTPAFAALVLALSCAPLGASAGGAVESARSGSVFKCSDGRELFARFTSQGAEAVAIVDAGDGPHVLPLRQGVPNVPEITWSDGQRTMTWSIGVQIMWMDGPSHLSCGRGAAHQH